MKHVEYELQLVFIFCFIKIKTKWEISILFDFNFNSRETQGKVVNKQARVDAVIVHGNNKYTQDKSMRTTVTQRNLIWPENNNTD